MDATASGDGRSLRIAVAAVVACSAVLRLAATWNDLWLDEIWSLTLVNTLHSPLGIVTELRHDNNHVLNTLALYCLRPLGSDWAYRLPAWVAGVATVLLGIRLAALEGDPHAGGRRLLAAIVLGGSYPLVHYGSEARGYALSIAFGLAAVAIAFGDGVTPRSRRAPLAWIALTLAFLAHALALHFLVALAAWTAVRALRRDGIARGLVTVVWWLGVPTVAFAVFYVGFLHGVTVGGGPREGALPPLLRAIATTTGLPFDTPPGVLAVVAGAVLAAGVGDLLRRRADAWAFYLTGIVGSPLLLGILQPTNLYAERYFLVSATLWLLVFAQLLTALWTRGIVPRILAAAMLAAFLAGNGARIAWLLRDGRGAYQEALAYMVRHTPDDALAVGSDHDFRNRLVIEYFAPRFPKPIRYVRVNELTAPGPRWYVAHRALGEAPPPPALTDRLGTRYRLETEYPTAPLSGFRWFVFQRVE
ncbi:MAG TPA: hypothetical protein VMS22_07080 [Candidatus Eisenbacteria bacterium]|nr:hypothetical protein [Candidatus Eisenbacteria bacterium]